MTTAPPLDERPVTSLRGVGPALAATLDRLGLRTVQDVLFHLPLRYEDRTRVVPIGTLRAGDRAVIEGEIQLAEVVFRRRRALLCRIADGSGFLTLRFFHFSAAQQESLTRGSRLRLVDDLALRLGEPAPDAEGLAHLQRVGAALHQHGAGGAQRLGCPLPGLLGAAALPLRVEEHLGVEASTCRLHLPVPEVRVGPREP